MDEKKIIEIQVDLGQAVQTIAALDKEIEQLKNDQKDNRKETDAQRAAYAATEVKIKEYTAQKRVLQREVQTEIKSSQEAMGAYAKLNIEYQKAAKLAKDLAIEKGLESEETKKAIANAERMDKRLKEADASVGQHTRNVGNYEVVLSKLPPSMQNFIQKSDGIASSLGFMTNGMGQASNGTGMLTQQLMKLAATPIGAIIMVIAAALMAVFKGMQTNREATERFNQILAPFKMLLNQILVVLGEVANFLLKGAQAMIDLTMSFLSFIPAVKTLNEQNKQSIEIERTLQRIRREEALDVADDAKRELQVAELKRKMREANKYTAQERIAFAKEIDKLERENALQDANRANEKLKAFLKQKALEGKTVKNFTEEELQEFTKLQADKYNQQKQYYENTLRTAGQAATLEREIAAESLARIQKAAEERKKANERFVQDLEEKLAIFQAKNKELSAKSAKDISDKETQINVEKYKRGLISKNQYELEKINIDNRYLDNLSKVHKSEIDKLTENLELKKALGKASNQELAKYELAILDKKFKDGLISEEAYLTAIANLQKQYAEKPATKTGLTPEQEAALKLDATIQGSMAEMDARLSILDLEKQKELSIEGTTEEQKLLIKKKYALAEKQIRQQVVENQLQVTSSALGQMAGLFSKGSKAGKAVASAQVAVDAIRGAMAAYSSAQALPFGLGVPVGIAAAAGVIATGARNIKSIWAVDENGTQSVSGSGGASTPDTASKMAAPLSTNVANISRFGGAQNIATGIAANSNALAVENATTAAINANTALPNIVVSVEEINRVQHNVKVIENSASFTK